MRERRHFQDCGIAYRAWCVLAYIAFRAIPARWVFSKPTHWLLQYAGHYAYAENRRTPPGDGDGGGAK